MLFQVSQGLGVYTAADLETQHMVPCSSQCSEHFPYGEIGSGSEGLRRGGTYVAIHVCTCSCLCTLVLHGGQRSMSLVSALGRPRQADTCEFKSSPVYTVSSRTARAV